ncbi:hypothetical protein [Bauldia sp.]|uniref:hypothetical protein n=1 Tax=Bauldia sp. TaxID=2575872 RepID=UPI003BACCAF0
MFRILVAGVAALGLGGYSAAACTGLGATQIDEIYPSGDVVPENLIRFYLYFTAPMSGADVLPSVTLSRSDGSLVNDAFLSNRFELWSPDRTRLTLLFDPGRVKTGLEAHDALGRALIAGQRYVLTIDTRARDAEGCDLAAAFSHSFVAGPSDAEPPDPGNWAVRVPKAGTTEPLRITLGSPHDHLSMAFRIQVRHDGETLPGRVELQADETIWEFTPRNQWAAERHEISIDERLEDLAGNRPGQLFDQPIDLALPRPELRLWFLPGAG